MFDTFSLTPRMNTSSISSRWKSFRCSRGVLDSSPSSHFIQPDIQTKACGRNLLDSPFLMPFTLSSGIHRCHKYLLETAWQRREIWSHFRRNKATESATNWEHFYKHAFIRIHQDPWQIKVAFKSFSYAWLSAKTSTIVKSSLGILFLRALEGYVVSHPCCLAHSAALPIHSEYTTLLRAHRHSWRWTQQALRRNHVWNCCQSSTAIRWRRNGGCVFEECDSAVYSIEKSCLAGSIAKETHVSAGYLFFRMYGSADSVVRWISKHFKSHAAAAAIIPNFMPPTAPGPAWIKSITKESMADMTLKQAACSRWTLLSSRNHNPSSSA